MRSARRRRSARRNACGADYKHVRRRPEIVALASRSHGDPETEAFLARLPIGERRTAGSSLKFCIIAEGGADVYPRFAPTMEWDTAAGDAVLRAAGGVVLDAGGEPSPTARWRPGFEMEDLWRGAMRTQRADVIVNAS